MHRRIAHHPALADVRAPGLELRLDQRHQPGPLLGQPQRRLQHLGQADEAGVASDDVDLFGDQAVVERAGVGLFEDDDARVLAQLPGELVGADVDRIDPGRASAEQHVGEPAGRRAHVQRHRAGDVETEKSEAMVELDAAARDPGMVFPAHFQRRILRQQLAGLGDLLLAAEHGASHDQRLGAAAAVRQPAGDEQLVCALPSHDFPRRAPRGHPRSGRARPRGHWRERTCR